jgi:hypothetical protein
VRRARVLLGASGVEVYTSRHRPDWSARFRELAERHGKLWTASVDDHGKGAYTPPPCGTPPWVVERLIDEPLPSGFAATAPMYPNAGPGTAPTAPA